jgi:hypothetical protein
MKCALDRIHLLEESVDNKVTIPRREAAAEQELPRGFAKAELKR